MGVRVELVTALRQHPIDERQRRVHRHAAAVGFQHRRIFREDGHARPDHRLREVNRRHRRYAFGPANHHVDGLRHFLFELAQKLAARDGRRARVAFAAHEHDARRQGVIAASDHAIAKLRSHRPSATNREACAQHRFEECLPTGVARSDVRGVRLLEGVINRGREGRVRVVGHAAHRMGHAGEKKLLSRFLSAVAIRRGHQLFGFRNGDGREQRRKDGAQGPPQPDVKEIRQVGVADVVVVRRVR
ncbi:conserved hypothetical protein [Ricinus communis]|uniref:Uncharacterized protein n=1 Tax=Ricinus communis TaxID=3988 RepID=B9T8R6_RICCO|nr:conserved hypothetical protein [Ricinus communis]